MIITMRYRIERAVGMHLQPSMDTPLHPDVVAIVDDVMAAIKWSPEAARVRKVRKLHCRYVGPDGRDYCGHCNRLTSSWVPYPCETIQAVGGDDE